MSMLKALIAAKMTGGGGGGGGGTGATRRVVMTAQDETAELQPNVLYVFPEMANLTITLAAITDSTIANEFHFFFTSGATATVTNFPAIPGLDDFSAEANKTYEINVLDGYALVASWPAS